MTRPEPAKYNSGDAADDADSEAVKSNKAAGHKRRTGRAANDFF